MTVTVSVDGVEVLLPPNAYDAIEAVSDRARASTEATIADDFRGLRCGSITPAGLLAFCLDGVEEAMTKNAWREYVAALLAAVGRARKARS